MSGERAERIARVYQLLGTIASNAAYIRDELPSLEMLDELRTEITGLCGEFDSALYDIRKEVRVREDKLGMHPGEEPFDPDVANTDPGTTISLIVEWLRREMDNLHGTVTKLQGLAEREPKLVVVEVLVEESGANILNAFIAIKDELVSLSAGLGQQPNA